MNINKNGELQIANIPLISDQYSWNTCGKQFLLLQFGKVALLLGFKLSNFLRLFFYHWRSSNTGNNRTLPRYKKRSWDFAEIDLNKPYTLFHCTSSKNKVETVWRWKSYVLRYRPQHDDTCNFFFSLFFFFTVIYKVTFLHIFPLCLDMKYRLLGLLPHPNPPPQSATGHYLMKKWCYSSQAP